MTMDEYQALAVRTCNKSLTKEQTINHALFEMCSELGEIHSFYQKQLQGHIINEDKMMLEVGDLLWGIAEFCEAMDWSLDDVAYKNIEKLRDRYPSGFDPQRSLYRGGEGK